MASEGDKSVGGRGLGRGLGRGRALLVSPTQKEAEKEAKEIESIPKQLVVTTDRISTPSTSVTPRPLSTQSSVTEEKVIGRPLGRGLRIRAVPSISSSVQQVSSAPYQGRGISEGLPGKLKESAEHEHLTKAFSEVALSSALPGRQEQPSTSAARERDVEVSAQPREPVLYRGNSGTREDFVLNHIHVKIKEGYSINEYHVTFSPEIDGRFLRFKIMKSLTDYYGTTRTFDGAKLCLPHKLPEKITILKALHPVDGTSVTVTLKFVGERNAKDCVQHFNVLLRRAMGALEMVEFNRHMYNPKLHIEIPHHKLSVWPGFITSIAEFEGGLMLCAETHHKILRTSTVGDFIYNLMQTNIRDFREKATKELLGSVVLTRYNNKTYTIHDILWDQSPMSTFKRGDKDITYVEYYQMQYGIKVRDTQQPLLLHRTTKKQPQGQAIERLICIIPELCNLTGLTDEMRIDFALMKDISAHTRLLPNARQNELVKFIQEINSSPKAKELFDGWGVTLLPELMKVPGRTFPEETIYFGNRNVKAGKEANWSRDLVKYSVLKAVHIDNWAILSTRKDQNRARDFVSMIQQVSVQLGVRVGDPFTYMLQDDSNNTLLVNLQKVINPELQLVVVISPTPRDDRYNLIKKVCCCDNPIPSQVINSRTLGNPQKLRSVTQKVLLQLNCKLGGELWSLNIPLTELMIVGMDSYHNKAASNKSVLGFVASMNKTATRWYCDAKFQTKGEEIGSLLNTSLVRAIKKYYEINHTLPKKFIFVRDGVSDGQLEHVSNYEMEQFKMAFESFKDYNPQYMMVVVQKRINTRIFSQVSGRFGKPDLGNPLPGSIVDQDVTRRYLCDFFLVSQHVTQGTVTPSHYIVLYNNIMTDNGLLSPDRVQQIMYKLTHLYYNWPGTVRVPAPCQYAHKLAFLVGQNIQREPNDVLMDRLFFL